jgi:hypothetical protein
VVLHPWITTTPQQRLEPQQPLHRQPPWQPRQPPPFQQPLQRELQQPPLQPRQPKQNAGASAVPLRAIINTTLYIEKYLPKE